MPLTEDQHPVEEFSAQGAGEALADRVHPRSLDSGTQDPGTGGLEYGVKGAGEVRSAVTNQELDACEPLVEAEGQVAGLLHGPLAGGVRGNATKVHPAGAVLDEHQDIQSLAQHGVHVQEVDREDPGSLGVQELPPGRVRAVRRWIDARSMQDLPDSGRGDRHAGLGQFALDAAVSPQWILFRQADDEAGDARCCRRAAGRAPLARVVFARDQPAVPGQQRRWRNREDGGPAPAGYEPR